MVMRWDTTSRRRGGSLLLNSINLVFTTFMNDNQILIIHSRGVYNNVWAKFGVITVFHCLL